MDKSKNALMQQLSESTVLGQVRPYAEDKYQPDRRLYKLLDKAKGVFTSYLTAKKKGTVPPEKLDAYCKHHLFDDFAQECQWAKGWVREEHATNPAISPDTKNHYLKDWTTFIDEIYKWLKAALEKGKTDFVDIEYKQLENKRDGLFERGSVFYEAKANHYEVEEDRLRAKLRRLADTTRPKKGGTDATQSGKAGEDDAYIPFTKAIEVSNGVLTRKKLEKAIKEGKPTKVRSKKPSKNRKNVHIKDVLSLIKKLSESDNAREEAARMFGKWKELAQAKRRKQTDLD